MRKEFEKRYGYEDVISISSSSSSSTLSSSDSSDSSSDSEKARKRKAKKKKAKKAKKAKMSGMDYRKLASRALADPAPMIPPPASPTVRYQQGPSQAQGVLHQNYYLPAHTFQAQTAANVQHSGLGLQQLQGQMHLQGQPPVGQPAAQGQPPLNAPGLQTQRSSAAQTLQDQLQDSQSLRYVQSS